MPLKMVSSRPQNRSRLKPNYSSTITAAKEKSPKSLPAIFGVSLKIAVGGEEKGGKPRKTPRSTFLEA